MPNPWAIASAVSTNSRPRPCRRIADATPRLPIHIISRSPLIRSFICTAALAERVLDRKETNASPRIKSTRTISRSAFRQQDCWKIEFATAKIRTEFKFLFSDAFICLAASLASMSFAFGTSLRNISVDDLATIRAFANCWTLVVFSYLTLKCGGKHPQQPSYSNLGCSRGLGCKAVVGLPSVSFNGETSCPQT